MSKFFSVTTQWFYDAVDKQKYEAGIGWPVDAVEISEEEWRKYTQTSPDGYVLGADAVGKPAWIVISPPTHEELTAAGDILKQEKISQANDYIYRKQWPGRAVLGRLKESELVKYNAWLDYLDILECVDCSVAPDIIWPALPAI